VDPLERGGYAEEVNLLLALLFASQTFWTLTTGPAPSPWPTPSAWPVSWYGTLYYPVYWPVCTTPATFHCRPPHRPVWPPHVPPGKHPVPMAKPPL
jgi:hypothetical protein